MSTRPVVTDADAQHLAQTARALVWALRRFGEREAGLARLPQSELEVLRVVVRRPGITISEVARFLGLQSSNVSTTVRHLVDRGLLEKRSDPADGRACHLHETALAERNNQLIDDMWLRGIRGLLAEMPPEDAAQLVESADLLARLGTMAAD
ncbi:MarR family winged helix-turn-helix transcriptional regulator [Nocardia callitridis]|uniref:MarR family transcriptional regulator n=1 Tax=Nocardia callitridis TaxID=648753 RepID=A0ABP9KVX7_9NOCA